MPRLATAKVTLLLLLLSLLCQTASARQDKFFGKRNIKDFIRWAIRSAVKQHCSARPDKIRHTSRCLSLCPEHFTACAGQCYSLQNTAVDYEAAERQCAQLNSTLAIPRTRADNLCVMGLSGNQSVWLGITDRKIEGVFQAADFTDLSELDGYHWQVGEPNNGRGLYLGAEDCVVMRDDLHGAWNDVRCRSTLPFMCQLV